MDEDVGSLNAREPAVVDAGDPARIDSLWHTLHRDMRRRGVDVHVADDVAQETWLRIATRPPRMDRPLRPWLRVVGARVLAELLRKDRSRSVRERRVARADETECADLAGDDSRVLKLVAELPAPYREVIRLRYVDGFEVDEIADRLARTPGTVRSQLKRGLDRLRARLEGAEEPEEGPRRYARALLGWLGFRRGERGLEPLWACAGIGGVLALAALVAWSLDRSGTLQDARIVELPVVDAAVSEERGARVVRAPAEANPAGDDAEETAVSSVPPRAAFGTVRFPDGTPAGGATVWKGSGKGREPELVARTDAAGRYEVEAVEFSRYLWAALPGWLPSRRTHVSTWIEGEPSDLVLASPRGHLALELRDEDGRILPGVELELDCSFDHPAVALFSAGGELQYETEVVSGWTDEEGRLELPKPPLPRARLSVRMPGRVAHVVPLELDAGDSERVLVLPRPALLGGTIVDALGEPIARASVELVTQSGLQTTLLESDASGAFEIALDPGPFELGVTEATTRGRRSCRAQGVLERDERRHSQWVLADEGSLHGVVLAAARPVQGALVICTPASGPKARAYTDAGGRFSLFGRTPGELVDLQVYSPVWELLAARESVPVGTEELVLAADVEATPRRLEVAFEGEDPGLVPTLVELRSSDLHYKAAVFPVDAATRTCVLEVPRSTGFQLFPWIPALGAWKVESSELAPGDFQRLRVPRPAHITFRVDLPPGVPASAIRGGLRVYGLKCTWVASQPGLLSIREVVLDPATLSASVRVMPGRNRWFFQGAGLTHAWGDLDTAEGESRSEHVRMDPGIEAEVIVRFPAAIEKAVAPLLAVHTKAGRMQLEGAPVQVKGRDATFRVGLPVDARLLQADAKGLRGWRTLVPGELDAARPSFTLELVAEGEFGYGKEARFDVARD